MSDTGDRVEKLCTLEGMLGEAASCPRDACPFWEHGDGAIASSCLFDDVAITLERTDVARQLLALRDRLLELRPRPEAIGGKASRR